MNRVLKLIEELRGRDGLTVEDQKNAWIVHIPKDGKYACEITIPHQRFEWFASVKLIEEKKEIWSDWMDHYGSPEEKLEREMSESISAYIRRVINCNDLPIPIYEDES